jgi:pimeloyl-ACP methyl ester carboxylesterase
MSSIPTLPGIASNMIQTARLKTHVLSSAEGGIPVLFVHGNASSATFWEEVMTMLPAGYRGIAPDLRGYGDTEFKPVDATRGLADFVDDLLAVMDALQIERFHVVGHSLGGAVVFNLVAAAPARVRSATLVATGSPFGFGGTRDETGTPCYSDFAGSGGGMVNPTFLQLMSEKNRGVDNPQASPRVVMNSFYWKPPFTPQREEDLLSSMLSERTGPDHYPGDFTTSSNWPGIAPGTVGVINALSPKYVGDSVVRFIAANPKPPVLWVRGTHDQITSDTSLFEFGMLGKLGAVPGWPGDDVFPPQPMVSQTRAVLGRYAEAGGAYVEHLIEDTGHTPFVEKPAEFMQVLLPHLGT